MKQEKVSKVCIVDLFLNGKT